MLKKILILFIVFVSLDSLHAQCPPNFQEDSEGNCVPIVPGRPIDGGVAILLALGAAYGVKKLKKED